MDMERASKMWDQYVGQQGPREFMESYDTDVSVQDAVAEYLETLDDMFGQGTSEEAPDDLDEALVAYIEDRVVVMYEHWADYDPIVNLMDDDIREELHFKMAPCSKQEFMDAYLVKHEAKFGKRFMV